MLAFEALRLGLLAAKHLGLLQPAAAFLLCSLLLSF
jgi:hypothetical protein